MSRRKRKLTPQQKSEKKRRQREYMTISIDGKQERVKRSPMIEGMSVEDFIRANADPIWLHENELWEYMDTDRDEGEETSDADGEPDSGNAGDRGDLDRSRRPVVLSSIVGVRGGRHRGD